jgi:hypothetical protein
MDVLVYLAAEPGRVIPKEELLEAVWGGAFVEEGALSQAIHSLRKALGDDARQPRYIQTIPKRGYRLIAPVEQGQELDLVPAGRLIESAPALSPESTDATRPGPPVSPRRWFWLGLAAAIGLITVAVLWLVWNRHGSAVKGKPRIVVLPFENSGKPEDIYFAHGLTEEISNDLASLPTLHVISQTSAIRFEKGRKPFSQIGKELQVDYVLQPVWHASRSTRSIAAIWR